MRLYSTNRKSDDVSFKEALFKGMPDDYGLYMPTSIPQMPSNFFEQLPNMTISEMAFAVSAALLREEIPEDELRPIIESAINFDAPMHGLEGNLYSLELFHGPTLAFKDFGARFMARTMSHFLRQEDFELNILVATSGDTGGAVASGFLQVPNIKVTILYPKGKVSHLQELQLTTNGHNISALEVDGTFDDCQAMVKKAFVDPDIRGKLRLTSANSINISRLIPQSFYYFYAWSRLLENGLPTVFTVPSGNFGNLCGGLIASKMGLPVQHFVCATNANAVVPHYLDTGIFEPKPSVKTVSNAMDVGNPSNFPRLQHLFGEDYQQMVHDLSGFGFSDEQTVDTIRQVYQEQGYVMCPHTAVGYLGMKRYLDQSGMKEVNGVFLSTAHPAKFIDVVEEAIGTSVDLPPALASLQDREKQALAVSNDFEDLKNYLLG